MGQKVNPHGLRVGVIKDWDSRWMTNDKELGDTIVEDYNLRKYLKKRLYDAGVPKIEIERSTNSIRVKIYCANPGMIKGKGGADIDILRKDITKMLKKGNDENYRVFVDVVEIKNRDMSAQLVAESIAKQLENRVAFRRAMKLAMKNTMKSRDARGGTAKGIKIKLSGRLGGAEIARSESQHEGTIPLQTLRADIDYGFAEAATTYGRIGVKVWIYKGEVLPEVKKPRQEGGDK